MSAAIQAVLIGFLVAMAGTIPRNLIFMANLRFHPEWPWAVPVVGIYLWFFWRYLRGDGPPASTSRFRHDALRANSVPARLWAWALLAGALGIVALVVALHLMNQLVVLPPQQAPELAALPAGTALGLLLAAAPVAGVVEEAAFRGYMQGPIERRYGLLVAIFITGTMFAIAHLDFTLVLWPYYLAVAAIYGTVTYFTQSILPAIVLHTGGNLYSNLDLWIHDRAEWQASSRHAALIWDAGAGQDFWRAVGVLVALLLATFWAYSRLSKAARLARARE